MQPYASRHEHLGDYLERVRLLLGLAICRYWYRQIEASGQLNDLFVSLEEMRRIARFDPPQTQAPESLGLPPLAHMETLVAEHRAHMASRLDATRAEHPDWLLPIEELRSAFGLLGPEVDMLMVLAGLQIDVGLHRLATFAWADFAIKEPTLGFVAEVVASGPGELICVQECGAPAHKLRRLQIIETSDNPRWSKRSPELFRTVRLADRVLAYLRGRRPALSTPHAAECDDLDLFCTLHSARPAVEDHGAPLPLDRAIRVAYRLKRSPDLDPALLASAAAIVVCVTPPSVSPGPCLRANMPKDNPVLEIHLPRALDGGEKTLSRVERALALGLREASLLRAVPLVVVGALLDEQGAATVIISALCRMLPQSPEMIFLSTDHVNRALRSALGPCPEIKLGGPSSEERLRCWRTVLAVQLEAQPELDQVVQDLAQRYTVGLDDIRRAARYALVQAQVQATGRPSQAPIAAAALQVAVRQQVEHQLNLLAEPFATTMGWDDLVLPEEVVGGIEEMLSYARHGKQVFDEWGFLKLNAYGRGLTALFEGPPGTGKTIVAAIMARELGCELYRIDLSQVVDKYIGETEKRLDRLFDEAERSKTVLLFDEADSLFGRRTSMTSSNDRYANMETNFLLQRIEHFEGTTILTTNHAGNLDEAFQRRIKFRLSFTLPDEAARERIWRKMLPDQVPVDDDIQWGRLARDFSMAPAHIKNAVLRAAFKAAREGLHLNHQLLYEAARFEYRELGNLVHDSSAT